MRRLTLRRMNQNSRLKRAYAVAKLCRDMGAEAKVSSIHVNAWFGAYSKADMAAIYLKDYCHADDAESEAMFFGDSPNDDPCLRRSR